MNTKNNNTGEGNAPRVIGKFVGKVVYGDNGICYRFLGSGQRYGFDSTYAVAAPGELAIPAESMPWPWNDNEMQILTPCKLNH